MTIKQYLYRFVYEQHWTIGFIISPLADIVNGSPYEVHFVRGMPHDRWFADPFILDYNEQSIQVLVEEFCYKIKRGRIAKLTIDRRNFRLISYKIILDLPTHLSFPYIERKDGRVYISPENSASGCWCKYEYDEDNDTLIKTQEIVREPLTDAIKINEFGEELIIATHIPTQNGNVLSVYYANGKKKYDIEFQSMIARNAGDVFKVGNIVYRPAQDCTKAYGEAVIIQEVSIGKNELCFNNILRLESPNSKYNTGCHTFNHYHGLSVIDVHGYRRNTLARLVTSIKRMMLHQPK